MCIDVFLNRYWLFTHLLLLYFLSIHEYKEGFPHLNRRFKDRECCWLYRL